MYLTIQKSNGSLTTFRLNSAGNDVGEVQVRAGNKPSVIWLYINPNRRVSGMGKQCLALLKRKYGTALATEHEVPTARSFWTHMREIGLAL